MNRMIMNKMREWGFPVFVIVTWLMGFAYTLTRLGETHRSHNLAAAAARVVPAPVPVSPYLANAE